MLSMRAAASLLASAGTTADLCAVARAAGIGSEFFALGATRLDSLGLESISDARIASGTAAGAIRVLAARLAPSATLGEWLPRAARSLATRAPHVLWIVAATDATGADAAIVAWSRGEHGPRLVSLRWETARVAPSDAETLCALAAVSGADDGQRYDGYLRTLGREGMTRRFYRALESQVRVLAGHVGAAEDIGHAIALLYTSRLLFLSFLEAKGWMDGDRAFIATRFDECMRDGGGFHRRVLRPLFFGTLNTPVARRAPAARRFGRIPFLNGGLFARTPVERRVPRWVFPDEAMGALLADVFQRFRFVAREDSSSWSDASIDPEMLGRAFESLMDPVERRAGGAFYTPHALVARVTDRALDAMARNASLSELRALRVLDPACGSGAFLVHALERLSELRRARGDAAAWSDVRRDVLARSIFGVDRNPTAVWICELRLWLSVVIESDVADPMRVPPLPNLDRNIRVGDALLGPGFAHDAGALPGGRRLAELRARYVRATGRRKRMLSLQLDREERRRVVQELERQQSAVRYARSELLAARRVKDLFGERSASSADAKRESRALRDRLRAIRKDLDRVRNGAALPFSFAALFGDAQSRGGFDMVLGNPPWVRLQRIARPLRERLRRAFAAYRSAPWSAGAARAGVARGFAGQVDLSALFTERAVRLLRDGGILSFLLPVKLWRSLAGGGLRELLLARTQLIRVEDLGDSQHGFDAAVYPSLLLARSQSRPGDAAVQMSVASGRNVREWRVALGDLSFDATPGAPWLILPDAQRAAFDRLRAAGEPLALTRFGAPRLGVKSGCNAAFLVRVSDCGDHIASVSDADGERGSVETALLRPALRGDAVERWQRGPTDEWILWTHDERGAPLDRLPERARRWLARRYGALASRSDARGTRWWSLFRVEAASGSRSRVVWADIGKAPRALVLPAGDPTVPLNSCYVLRCTDEDDARALATLLNSSIAAAWLNALAEPARGGYRRYLGWTVGQLPVPHDWARARVVLASAFGADDDVLRAAALEAFALPPSAVAALQSDPT